MTVSSTSLCHHYNLHLVITDWSTDFLCSLFFFVQAVGINPSHMMQKDVHIQLLLSNKGWSVLLQGVLSIVSESAEWQLSSVVRSTCTYTDSILALLLPALPNQKNSCATLVPYPPQVIHRCTMAVLQDQLEQMCVWKVLVLSLA